VAQVHIFSIEQEASSSLMSAREVQAWQVQICSARGRVIAVRERVQQRQKSECSERERPQAERVMRQKIEASSSHVFLLLPEGMHSVAQMLEAERQQPPMSACLLQPMSAKAEAQAPLPSACHECFYARERATQAKVYTAQQRGGGSRRERFARGETLRRVQHREAHIWENRREAGKEAMQREKRSLLREAASSGRRAFFVRRAAGRKGSARAGKHMRGVMRARRAAAATKSYMARSTYECE